MLTIIEETRHSDLLELGVSPRGSLALLRAARALAFVEGRNYVIPDDIKRLAIPVLTHRVMPRSVGTVRSERMREAERIIADIVASVAIPL